MWYIFFQALRHDYAAGAVHCLVHNSLFVACKVQKMNAVVYMYNSMLLIPYIITDAQSQSHLKQS